MNFDFGLYASSIELDPNRNILFCVLKNKEDKDHQ
jgi:hypothetical protein